MKQLEQLMDLLGIAEEDAMSALLSVFASVQPGPMRQKMLQRNGNAPRTREIWDLLVNSGFRCGMCSAHGELTLDHINRDTRDSSLENLRVLCRDCNRGISSRKVVNKRAGLRIYQAFMDLCNQTGQVPTSAQIRDAAEPKDIDAALYMLRFLEAKLGKPRPLRAYRQRKNVPLIS